ncbi:MAG: hypothetical protein ACREPY_07255, partial [Rhodanobacteraceae bacterium]
MHTGKFVVIPGAITDCIGDRTRNLPLMATEAKSRLTRAIPGARPLGRLRRSRLQSLQTQSGSVCDEAAD